MVLHRHGKALYDGLVETVTEHLREIAAAVDGVQGDHFLTELERRWQDHTKSMQMIRDILMYMDRIYVQPHRRGVIVQESGARGSGSNVHGFGCTAYSTYGSGCRGFGVQHLLACTLKHSLL